MDAEQLHFPDFTAPDFGQPELERVDLATPGFTLPDPERPEQLKALQLSFWPENLDALDTEHPDPASPDLTEPELPAGLALADPRVHAMPQPEYAPQVVMRERPGELDPAALETVLGGADNKELPPGITYPQLYSSEDEISSRKRHLGMLELGLEQAERDER